MEEEVAEEEGVAVAAEVSAAFLLVFVCQAKQYLFT